MNFDIREGSHLEAYHVACEIPEFGNQAYDLEEYKRRLVNSHHILIGFYENQPVGFKAGYQRGEQGQFYSWMGGVLPGYRKYGIAKSLAQQQETWARDKGYAKIRFKTRNYLKSMLIFSLKNGFNIIEVEPREEVFQNRILLEKKLND